jgi:alpha-L-fucosidase
MKLLRTCPSLIKTALLACALLALAATGCRLCSGNKCCTAPPKSSADLPKADLTIDTNVPASHDEKMAWFREAKFGLFIHWGLYCIPSGEWKGKPVAGLGEWIMNRAQIPVTEYSQLAKQFDPVKFNAEEWVQMAEDAGMKYIVITAKHHEGFAMYHSSVSPYNVYDATPFHRDPIHELAEACARHHMRFGFYYSQAQDWHEPNGAGNTWDFGPDEKKNFDVYLQGKAEPQVRELLSNYGPVCLIWFDTPRMMTKERGQRFVDIVQSLQPRTLIDGRLGTAGDYASTGDNAIPDTARTDDWETPATINHTWGYKKDDTDWKSPGEVTFKLVDIVSKGGNYLLNVGPTSQGVIPEGSQATLRSVGRWLKVNGDAVYGAGRSPFTNEFGEYSRDLHDRSGHPIFLERDDWRCTTRPGTLYFTIFKMPRDGFELPPFKNEIKKAYFLADPDHANIPVVTTNEVRVVQTPRYGPDAMASVLCVDIDGSQVEQ